MKRFILILCFLIVGISFAYPSNYPAVTPENVMNLHEVETLGLGSLSGKLVWSPDASQIVAGGSQGIFLFDSNYQNIGFIEMGKPVTVLEYAPDGSFVFAYFDGKVNAFDLETKTVRYQLETTNILAIGSEFGQLVAYQGYQAIIVADVATGETRHVLDYGELWLPDYSAAYDYRRTQALFAQFYNNDEGLAVHWRSDEGGAYDEYVYSYQTTDYWILDSAQRQDMSDIYPAEPGTNHFAAFGADGSMFQISWSSYFYGTDGTELAIGGERRSVYVISQPDEYVLSGNLLAMPSCSYNEGCNPQSTVVWDVQTAQIVATLPKAGNMDFSPDGTNLSIDNEIYDLATGEQVAVLQTDEYRALLRANDRLLKYGADDSLQLLDAMSLETITELPMLRSDLKEIWEIFSDGSFVLVHKNGDLFIRISGETGAEIMRMNAASRFYSPHLSANERYFFVAYSSSGFVLEGVWDANTGERIEFPVDFVPLLTHFEANQVIGWTGESIGFFDLSQREYVEQIAVEQSFEVAATALSMSSDEQYLAIHFNQEGLVIRRDTGAIVTSFTGDAVFNPSASLLAYSDAERNVWIMSLPDEEIIHHWYIRSGMPFFGGLGFQNDEILNVYMGGPDGGNEVIGYEARTGYKALGTYPQYQPLPMQPFAEANGLRFYNDNGLRIEWNEQPISLRLNPANYSSANLSSDGTRLYINTTDGRVGIWAVEE